MIELDTNPYSAPWRLIGETVEVVVASGSERSALQGPQRHDFKD